MNIIMSNKYSITSFKGEGAEDIRSNGSHYPWFYKNKKQKKTNVHVWMCGCGQFEMTCISPEDLMGND